MNTKPSEIETEKKEEPKYTHDQLLKALYFILDLFSRANTPFFLLDDTAYQVKNGLSLSGDKITAGIRYLDYQGRSFSILEAFMKADSMDKHNILYTFEGIPIQVKIIKSSDPMFTATDSLVYQHEFFNLPNPFNKYWEIHNTL